MERLIQSAICTLRLKHNFSIHEIDENFGPAIQDLRQLKEAVKDLPSPFYNKKNKSYQSYLNNRSVVVPFIHNKKIF
jgi:hypothetical protein